MREQSGNRLKTLVESEADNRKVIEEIYLQLPEPSSDGEGVDRHSPKVASAWKRPRT